MLYYTIKFFQNAEFTLSESSLQYFSISDGTLQLVQALDFETQPTFELEIFGKGSETSGESFEAVCNVMVRFLVLLFL